MVLIAKNAMRRIRRECRRWPTETGGILIGPAGSQVITEFIPSGQAARRSYAMYEQTQADVDYLNGELRKRQANGLEFQGYIHRHPGQFDRPSGTDLDTARDVLTSPSYSLNGRMWMAIVTWQGRSWRPAKRSFKVDFYEVSLHADGTVSCRREDHEEIEDGDPRTNTRCAQNARGRAADEGDTPYESVARERDWYFLKTLGGRNVLWKEVEDLKTAGYSVQVKILDGFACLEIMLPDDRVLAAFLPDEYPLAPPRIFMLHDDDRQDELTVAAFSRWSSLFSIKEILDEICLDRSET